MIDPFLSLVFTMQSGPGRYALLLGSGVSRGAGIPTGWDITEDLVYKLADLLGENCGDDPISWYLDKYSEEVSYSKLINKLAPASTARKELLRGYFEPTEEDEENTKQPTAAHKAIAKLAKAGYIRVIITTNFDRLLEKALSDEDTSYVVLRTPADVRGAEPFVHTECCVFKVHGDYLDPENIRNTSDELKEYPREYKSLLNRIFDEYGLIVCGWSAKWDNLLRDILKGTKSRRYTTYWATRRSDLSDEAASLIKSRKAEKITIENADNFFSSLMEKVEELENYQSPHPLDQKIMIGRLRRYMAENKYRIKHADLVRTEVERILPRISPNILGEMWDTAKKSSSSLPLQRWREKVEDTMDTVIRMSVEAGIWAKEEYYGIWIEVFRKLAVLPISDNLRGIELGRREDKLYPYKVARYPGTLLLFSLGLMATKAENFPFLQKIFMDSISSGFEESEVDILPSNRRTVTRLINPRWRWGDEIDPRYLVGSMDFTDFNKKILEALYLFVENYFPNKEEYTRIFNKFEILLSIASHLRDTEGEYYFPGNSFGPFNGLPYPIGEIENISLSISRERENSPYVAYKLFGTSLPECRAVFRRFREYHAPRRSR